MRLGAVIAGFGLSSFPADGASPSSAACAGDCPPIVSTPPALLERGEALEASKKLADAGHHLLAADLALLAGDPGRALQILEPLRDAGDPERELDGREAEGGGLRTGRWLRISVEAHLGRGELDRARAESARLAEIEGWEAQARKFQDDIDQRTLSMRLSEFGLMVYALAIAFLVLYGSRELVTLRSEPVVMVAAGVVAYGLARLASPPLGPVVGLLAAGLVALVHATGAAFRRLVPGPRWSILLLTLLLLGSVGVSLAVLFRIEPHVLSSAFGG